MRFSALPESKKGSTHSVMKNARPSSRVPQAHVKVDAHRGKANMTQNKRREKHQAVHAAKKRVIKKGNDQVPVRISHPYVFVGNLRPTITVPRLHELFAPCGEILDIVVRCSLGSAVTATRSQDDSIDLWYASVTFRGLSAAKQALALTGTELDGRKIVVCKLPGELPEVLRKAQMRFGQNQERKGLTNPFRRARNRLVAQPTELINPDDRHKVFGISFAKCIL